MPQSPGAGCWLRSRTNRDVDPTLPLSHAEDDLTPDADRKAGGHVAGGPCHTPLALALPAAGPRDDSASVSVLCNIFHHPHH